MKTTQSENHKNQPIGSPAKALTDLPVSTGQSEQAKGGGFEHHGHGTHVAGTIGAVSN
jgi:hypothetical protein